MTTHTLPRYRTLTPVFKDSLSPGSIFLYRKSSFRPNGKDTFHYKLDSVDSPSGYHYLPQKRRTTVDVVFHHIKNNVDPYVNASNWLPKFKDLCKGFLALKNAEKLKKNNEAARVIQKAAESHLDPWMLLFQAIKPTFKVVKVDSLKKYLKDCIIQIKKLNSERNFIESQLNDVEDIMEEAYNIHDNSSLSVDERRSPNMFAKLIETQKSANDDTFLKECLDIEIEGITDAKFSFDPFDCQNSKVNLVYELAIKLQQKINEDHHKWRNIQEKCANLEKEVADLRSTNSTLDTTTRMLRGMINKNDLNLNDQKDKVQEYVSLLEKINQEKRTLANKIKECEKELALSQETLLETNGKCEYFENELDRKTQALEILSQENIRQDKKVKELEDKFNYSLETQNDLEYTIKLQKSRLTDLKKRLTEQLKTTEEELMQTINDLKFQLKEQSELIEGQNEKIKQYDNTIRKLEHDVVDAIHKDGSDEEIDFERERKLGKQLKNANANIETMRDDMKVMELNYEELEKRVKEVQTNLDRANEETTEHKKINERLKAKIETSKSALNDTELKLTRANREKNFNCQKWTQAKERNVELEKEVLKLQEELNHSMHAMTAKYREIETLEKEYNESRKEIENKISHYERNINHLEDKLEENTNLHSHKNEEWKKSAKMYEDRIDELQQSLEEKEIEIDQYDLEKNSFNKSLKKLQRQINEYKETQADDKKTIIKLKDQLKILQDESESQWNMMTSGFTTPIDQRVLDLHSRERNLSRSSSSMTTPSSTQNERYFTLQHRRGAHK